MASMFQEIYTVVKRIPAGRAACYDDVARLAGNSRLSRVVGYAMHACADETVPCHRVVHKDGSLAERFGAAGNDLQRALLMAEGVRFLADGRVDMDQSGWNAYSAKSEGR